MAGTGAGAGRQHLMSVQKQHGRIFSGDDIDAACDECEIDEVQRAFNVAQPWNGRPGITPDKLRARLLRRGFGPAAVDEALERLNDASDPL